MRCACIDIGSNTTRLLVAEYGEQAPAAGGAQLRELAGERVFTTIGAAIAPDGSIPPAKVAEVADVVAAQAASARRHGAEQVRVVATAAIRAAPNAAELSAALARVAGVELEILTTEHEARLAFAGAIASLAGEPTGQIAVVDVGGGSTELAVGTFAGPDWWVSMPAGSSSLTRACVTADPPSAACVAALRAAADAAFAAIAPPHADLVLAVGGSATTLLLLADEALDRLALDRALDEIVAAPVAVTSLRLGLHPERTRVLPAGIVLLARAGDTFGAPLHVARGGLREGAILEAVGR